MRSSSPYRPTIAFGPGPVSPAIKALIIANVALFLLTTIAAGFDYNVTWYFGLRPVDVWESFRVWQVATYMFLHADVFHLLFNMLALWMFGTELERTWGTRYLVKYYTLTGIGAALLTLLVARLIPTGPLHLWNTTIIGASGAIFGLLLAYALYFPHRNLMMFFVFNVPVRWAVAIIGAMALYSSFADSAGIANVTHLGGILVGYLLLRGARMDPIGEIKYRYLRLKMGRNRRKFDVYTGGRKDWDRKIH
jgi:membrane associated rhomboid family serine protease